MKPDEGISSPTVEQTQSTKENAMPASVTITIPDANIARVKSMVEHLAGRVLGDARFTELAPGKTPGDSLTNGEAVAIYKDMLINFTRELVKQVEVDTAVESARQTAVSGVASDFAT